MTVIEERLGKCAIDEGHMRVQDGGGNSFSIEVELRNAASLLRVEIIDTGQTRQGAGQCGEGVVPPSIVMPNIFF